jgi:hypothetical protein
MSVEMTVENVLEQFAILSAKDQQKFAAQMARHLQGQPKKASKAKKEKEGEEKTKRVQSEGQKMWHALVRIVRETIKTEVAPEKNVQTPVFCVAGRFKENDNMAPSSEEIIEMYNAYIAKPWESKTSKSRAEGGSVSSGKKASSAEESEVEEIEVKAKPKTEVKKADPKPKVEAKKAEVKPKAEPKKAEPKKAEPKEEVKEETVMKAVKWAHDGKKYRRAAVAPFHCWDLSSGEYAGVWDAERKEFDTTYSDPELDDE